MKTKGICYIFGAGEHDGTHLLPGPDDLVIAADGGYAHLQKHGLPAHIIIGDLDSLPDSPEGVPLERLPKEKDHTDMAAAIGYGLKAGYRIFRIYGGCGGRIEHTLANVQILADLARQGARGFLFDGESVITAIYNGSISFPRGASGYVSAFAHSNEALGVWERGLKYPLCDAALRNILPLGVSNEFMGQASEISVREGTLIVVFPANVHEIDYLT
ncbi:MAG: thiamine diphosphokinase [Clostridia bacterium]|nr:thiamine diphosphokinase [Clostridia bacterium]